MLVVHQGKTLSEKLAHVRVTDLENTTWLVADLKSKSELQRELLARTKCLPEDAVIRVSEFWQKLFHQIEPGFELVSPAFVTTFLAEWLAARKLAWADHPGTPRLLAEYIDLFLPILTRDELVEQTREWLKQNPSALIRWGSWFELALEAWQVFSEQKMLARAWTAGYLSGLERGQWPWQRRLIFDLGADLTGVEAELITQFSRAGLDVEVYAPDRRRREKYVSCLWPYSQLLGEKFLSKNEALKGSGLSGDLTPKRFTSPLAEVKSAVAEVYRALEAGVAPNEIGIFAAQIEDYWSTLEAYAGVEGLPLAKNVVLSGVSLPAAARWLARLRVESRDIASGDLEHALYGQTENAPPLAFEIFAPLYNKIYDAEDVGRDARVREALKFKFQASDRLSRDEFFDWALPFWQGGALGVDKVAAAIFQECPRGLKLELKSWIRYVESILPKIELTAREGVSGGVHVGNFDSAAHLSLKKIVLLGLSESDLAEQSEMAVSHTDVVKIATDLGVNLRHLGARLGAYWVEHLIQQANGSVDLYFSATDLAGQPQTPSLLWLEAAAPKLQDLEKCVAPQPSRWDEIQLAQGHSDENKILKYLAAVDVGLREPENIQHGISLRYSITQIENYLECPFIFTAKKLFRLSDVPDVDLDIDNLTRGRLLHAALDQILAAPLKLAWSRPEIADLVDRLRDQLGVVLGFQELWSTQRERYIEIIERFLNFETQWRKDFSATQTVGREVPVRGELTLNENLKIEVSGKIDRVDSNGCGEFVVLDYKSSGAGLRNYSSWLQNDELQLLFYSLCLEEGLVEGARGPVIGAFYFILANMNREKGFRDSSKVGDIFSEATRSRTQIDRAAVLKLYEELKEKIAGVIQNISAGVLHPNPREHQQCPTCTWKTVCRSPHLN